MHSQELRPTLQRDPSGVREWQQSGNWEFPFRRYVLAGYTKVIKDVRGKEVDLNNHSLKDHFEMLGQKL